MSRKCAKALHNMRKLLIKLIICQHENPSNNNAKYVTTEMSNRVELFHLYIVQISM